MRSWIVSWSGSDMSDAIGPHEFFKLLKRKLGPLSEIT